uniref:CCHC-type domain-containing protein n=1 Tax=Cajanus cajan TaxID=3821 RepID=A0A151QUE3_CAJCA|nr:hypothetical protein KK1_045219 [Cajanus cajan]
MSNIVKLEVVAFNIMEKNYLSWILDVEIQLDAIGRKDSIKEGNVVSNQDKAKVIIFLRYHIHKGLKNGQTHDRGRGHGYENSHDCGYGGNYGHGYEVNNNFSHKKWKNNGKNKKETGGHGNRHEENKCYHCGGKSHWSHTCRTQMHLVEIYQESLKNKKKKIETHFTYEDGGSDYGHMDVTHLDVIDFFVDPNEKINHLIGDESIQK